MSFMRRFPLSVAPALACVFLWASPAVAHGPCGCLDPVVVQVGDQVRIKETAAQPRGVGWPAYRVVFNPRPSDFGIAPSYLASAYRADAPTTTVLSRSRHNPTREGRFRVPKGTPPGLYMVMIWDGGEAGAHNSWEYLHVTDRDEPHGLGVVAHEQEEFSESAERNSPEETKGPAEGSPRPEKRSESNGSVPWPLAAGIGLGGLFVGVVGSRVVARRQA